MNRQRKRGGEILQKNEAVFLKAMTPDSYYYNLGNGKEALYKVRKYGPGLPSPQRINPELIEAKNCLYRAYKLGGKPNDPLALKIQCNLAGNLGQAGRVIDTIRYYQQILVVDPLFPQALIGLAENLDYWSLTASYPGTQALSSTIFAHYQSGTALANLPLLYQGRVMETFRKYESVIKEWKLTPESLQEEFKDAQLEYEQQSSYIKFCLDNYLMLNEHSVYCKCNKSAGDDLSIGRVAAVFKSCKVPKLELLLNRLKAEFAFARKLYYESLGETETEETIYYDLGENEVIGANAEKLRASFKACFSIFDKIAHGICFFYDLREKANEPIYFNSFFENKTRWQKIKDRRNPHLTALYSIASDFNRKEGEFGFYKEWRNTLEHNLFVLTSDGEYADPFKIFADTGFVQQVSFDFFREQVLHLLQMCRSAIFSYAYCIRMETIQAEQDSKKPSITISPKKL
jgi:tetratricopeptide (TPR) repeat protein